MLLQVSLAKPFIQLMPVNPLPGGPAEPQLTGVHSPLRWKFTTFKVLPL
jgi:hypothetical protein